MCVCVCVCVCVCEEGLSAELTLHIARIPNTGMDGSTLADRLGSQHFLFKTDIIEKDYSTMYLIKEIISGIVNTSEHMKIHK